MVWEGETGKVNTEKSSQEGKMYLRGGNQKGMRSKGSGQKSVRRRGGGKKSLDRGGRNFIVPGDDGKNRGGDWPHRRRKGNELQQPARLNLEGEAHGRELPRPQKNTVGSTPIRAKKPSWKKSKAKVQFKGPLVQGEK